MSKTFILGAGFSRCSGLPIQSEFSHLLLSEEFDSDIDRVITRILHEFLQDVFGWTDGEPLPSLEDIFTCIDLSAGTGHHLGVKYTPKVLRAVRRIAIYRLFSVLDRRFHYSDEISALLGNTITAKDHPSFVVLNWDIVLEKHLSNTHPGWQIDYCCEANNWNLCTGEEGLPAIQVCKLHGSSNWVYCENCLALFYDLDSKLSLHSKVGLIKSDFRLFDEGFTNRRFDNCIAIPPSTRQCRRCKNMVSSHIATFSFRKSFRTHAYSSIWHCAEEILSKSEHWVFIGYSLPQADFEFKHLLKAAQLRYCHLNGRTHTIEVVSKGDAARSEFEKFFGAGNVIYHGSELSGYVSRKVDSASPINTAIFSVDVR